MKKLLVINYQLLETGLPPAENILNFLPKAGRPVKLITNNYKLKTNLGMTLIEVLMAVVILGTVLVGLLQGLTQSLKVFSFSARIDELQRVLDAGDTLYPIRTQIISDPEKDLEVVSDRGIVDGYTYERTSVKLQEEGASTDDYLYLVTTTVKYGSGGAGSELTVERYVYFRK